MSFTLATLKSAVQDYLQVDETTFNDNLNTFHTGGGDTHL
jgi:hypothetical protein